MANLDNIMDYLADNAIHYKDYSGTTGSTQTNGWYYLDVNLNLPTGASVQPLQGGDMTDILIECTNKIISAMNNTTAHITVDDPYRIFKLVRQEEIKNRIITGAV